MFGGGAAASAGLSPGAGDGGDFFMFQASPPIGDAPAGGAPNVAKLLLGVVFMAVNVVVEIFKVLGNMFKLVSSDTVLDGKKINSNNPFKNLFGGGNSVQGRDVKNLPGGHWNLNEAMRSHESRFQGNDTRLASLEAWRNMEATRIPPGAVPYPSSKKIIPAQGPGTETL
jgi:hypothetical protein